MKALIVTRYSDKKQHGGTSTEVQIQACNNYCKQKDLEIVDELHFKAESAKASNTARIKKLLDFCKQYKGKVDVLVVYKLDRFARDVGVHYFLKNELLKMDISLQSATEPIDTSPAGQLTENMLAAIAQFSNDQKSERVKAAMKQKCQLGIWPWKAPIGYLNVKDSHNKADVAQIDPDLSPYAKKIFNWYGYNKMGIVEISNKLKKLNLRDIKGKIIKFSPQTIDRILNNKFYIGILEVDTWNETFEGAHEPLVDSKTWNKCQKRLHPVITNKSNEVGASRTQLNSDFPLRDHLKCGFCYEPMTAAWCQGKNKKYPYYYCNNPDCPNPGKKSNDKFKFEKKFKKFLDKIRPSEELQSYIGKRLLEKYQERKDEFETHASKQRKLLDQLEEKKENLVEAIAEGIDQKDIVGPLNKIKEEIALTKLSLNEAHTGEFEMDLLLSYAKKFFTRMSILWFEVADPNLKVRLQRVLFPEGLIYTNQDNFSNTKLRPYLRYLYESKQSDSTIVTPRGIEPRFTG